MRGQNLRDPEQQAEGITTEGQQPGPSHTLAPTRTSLQVLRINSTSLHPTGTAPYNSLESGTLFGTQNPELPGTLVRTRNPDPGTPRNIQLPGALNVVPRLSLPSQQTRPKVPLHPSVRATIYRQKWASGEGAIGSGSRLVPGDWVHVPVRSCEGSSPDMRRASARLLGCPLSVEQRLDSRSTSEQQKYF